MARPSKNYLSSALYLTLLVVIILLMFHFIPTQVAEKFHLKNVDLFSDIRKDEPQEIITPVTTIPEPPRLDTCRTGLTCFDDYSPGGNGLDPFFDALDSGKKVRIAFFGDSFIEGDIFSGDLRSKLQEKYGGSGAGMLPLSSPINSFRRTVIHQYKGWKDFSILDSGKIPQPGISGHVYAPTENSWVYYAGAKKEDIQDSCQNISVLYHLKRGTANLYYNINKSEKGNQVLSPSDRLQKVEIDYPEIGNISLSFSGETENLHIYGVSMENNSGIILDNFSLRGISGSSLQNISLLNEFDSLLNYNLIILHYGLNVVEAKRTNYDAYQKSMVKTINYLKTCFPNSCFLLVGVPDRSMRSKGEYQTMPTIPAMINAQKHICAETGIVFWNLFEAMGGENSMIDLVKSSPPRANKDYTHLTFKGGEYLGNIFYETIAYEKERYDKKKIYYGAME